MCCVTANSRVICGRIISAPTHTANLRHIVEDGFSVPHQFALYFAFAHRLLLSSDLVGNALYAFRKFRANRQKRSDEGVAPYVVNFINELWFAQNYRIAQPSRNAYNAFPTICLEAMCQIPQNK